MTRYAAFLRAVNVGGRTLDMGALRRLCEELGFTGVATYIQSGNLVFGADGRSEPEVVELLEARIAADLEVPTRVLLRTSTELGAIAKRHPFSARETVGSRLFVTFLASKPDPARAASLKVPPGESARARVVGREVYLHFPDGYGRTKMGLPYLERSLAVVGTTRNWNTVQKLAGMTGLP